MGRMAVVASDTTVEGLSPLAVYCLSSASRLFSCGLTSDPGQGCYTGGRYFHTNLSFGTTSQQLLLHVFGSPPIGRQRRKTQPANMRNCRDYGQFRGTSWLVATVEVQLEKSSTYKSTSFFGVRYYSERCMPVARLS